MVKAIVLSIGVISVSFFATENTFANSNVEIKSEILESKEDIDPQEIDIITSATVKRAKFEFKNNSNNGRNWFGNIYEIKHGPLSMKKSEEDNYNKQRSRTYYLEYPYIKLEGTLGVIDYGENEYLIKSKGYKDIKIDYLFEKPIKINAKLKSKYKIDEDVNFEINSDIDPEKAILFFSFNHKPIYNDKIKLFKEKDKTYLKIYKSLLQEGENILEITTNAGAPMENVDLKINVGDFKKIDIDIEIYLENAGKVELPDSIYETDNLVLEAKPNENFKFLNWNINGNIVSEEKFLEIEASEDIKIKAVFKEIKEEIKEPEENQDDKNNDSTDKNNRNKKNRKNNRLEIKKATKKESETKEIRVKEKVIYLKGYPDNTFKADNNITIAETLKIFSELLDDDIDIKDFNSKYKDIIKNEWYVESLHKLEKKGYLNNIFKEENININRNITRAEFVALASNFTKEALGTNTFKDINDNFWAKEEIDKFVGLDYINGYPDGEFKPEKEITRAEVSKILIKMLNINIDKNINNKYSDLEKSHWAYYEILNLSK